MHGMNNIKCLEDLEVTGLVVLNWILKEQGGMRWTEVTWLRRAQVTRPCGHLMNLRVQIIFRLILEILTSKEALHWMELRVVG
jgi:hypothetical protein